MIGRVVLCGLLVLASSACTPRWPHQRLSRAEVASCAARGGYESRSAFGFPICQIRYADGGKTCSNDADCLGKCLDERPEAVDLKVGMVATGHCEAEQYTPGCYAIIDGGKVVDVSCFE